MWSGLQHGVGVQTLPPQQQKASMAEPCHCSRRFNELFMEKEEDAVILLRSLEDAAEAAGDNLEAVGQVFKRFVDLHGEMLRWVRAASSS